MRPTVFLVTALLCSPSSFAYAKTDADPYKPVLDRLESLTILAQPEWRYHADIPHPEDRELNDEDWPTVKTREVWKTGTRVLRRWVEVPEKINGYGTLGAKVSLELYFGSDERLLITVFSNGSLVARGDDDTQQPIPLTNSAQPGQKFLIAVRLDCPEVNTQVYESQLRIEPNASRPDPETIRTEIRSVRPLIAAFPEGRAEREGAVDAAVKAIDFAALDKGDQGAFDASLRNAQSKLEPLRPWLQKYAIQAVGNSHIDMAWLWPWTETVEVVRNTFRTALDLMREYPDFRFTMSSARTYSWMEEKYPDLFKEIKQRVQEGRWEIVGGMWVEPDLNMPGGESLVRQILTGKRYFQQKFGVDVKIGWNPDSFGYSWQLPQIYKKSGIDYFVTQKLYWNDTTKFPHKLFWWEAPDGSRLLAYIPHDYANDTDPVKMATDLAAFAPAMYVSDPAGGWRWRPRRRSYAFDARHREALDDKRCCLPTIALWHGARLL
jgi:alpha-mannosidase